MLLRMWCSCEYKLGEKYNIQAQLDGKAQKRFQTLPFPFDWCRNHCPIAVKRHHDQGNSYERKHLIGGLFTLSKV